jgi:hypothetical protein
MLEEEDAEFPSAEDRRRLEAMREKELNPSRMPREQRRSKAKGVAVVGNGNASSTVGAQANGTRTRKTRTVSSVSRKVSTVSTRPLSTASTPSSEVAAMEALYANRAASMSESRLVGYLSLPLFSQHAEFLPRQRMLAWIFLASEQSFLWLQLRLARIRTPLFSPELIA